MKNAYYLLLCCTLFSQTVHSQYYYYNSRFYESNMIWELGASAMGINGLTDLGGGKGKSIVHHIDWRNTSPGISFYGKLLYNESIAIRLESTIGKIRACDSLLRNKMYAPGRYRRNLQVETNIIEGLLLGEFYPLSLITAERHPVSWLNIYLVAGIGFFHFNPTAKYGTVPVRLQPLRTEGQGFPDYPDRKPYALNQWNFPAGIGWRCEISALLVCGFELMYRKLFTDYLDDVSTTYVNPLLFDQHLSPVQAEWARKMADPGRKEFPPHQPGQQRGNPANNDAYFSFNLKAAITIGREKR